eukprot:TRINITY_DN72044_c0_g1_i1.p5 TRINITY_DN72044_c0_g1~~TRINITY_DN72044_c0_g1_i1.p5  ORF type:complete len:139 (+),score=13.93 TRINITY_DN72044_c0_g1_i1:110-526(+)
MFSKSVIFLWYTAVSGIYNTQECSSQTESNELQLQQLQDSIVELQTTVKLLQAEVRSNALVLEDMQKQIPPLCNSASINSQSTQMHSQGDGGSRELAKARNIWSDFFSFKSALNIEATALECISPDQNVEEEEESFIL